MNPGFTILSGALKLGARMDANLMGLIVVPIGVFLCFGPALLVWLREELASEGPDGKKKIP